MSQVRYPHRATKRVEVVEPLNGPRLHDRIYSDILVAGLDFRRAFTFCTMNAVLNGIPGIHIHGDTLKMEIWDAFATLPIGRFALWERLRPEIARDLIVQSLKTPVEPAKPAPPAPKPIPKEAVQARLFQDGETA